MSTELTRALNKAKVGLLQIKNSAFISTILFSLRFSWDKTIPTACTNGIKLLVNPDFFMSLDKEERIFLLAHESWHVAFQHMARLDKTKKDNFSVWNQATDHYINLMLIAAGYKMIQGGLADTKFSDQQVWSSDAIFNHLMENEEDQVQDFTEDFDPSAASGDGDNGSESGGTGNDNGDGTGKMSPEEVQKKIEDVIIKAAMQSKMSSDGAGAIPNEIEIALDKLLNPKLPWNVILQNYMAAYAKEDFSWRKPNRRYMPREMYMPSLYSESLGHVGVAVDTSCSVTDEQFAAFRTEIVTLHQTYNPERLTVVDFDTRIHNVHDLSQGDDATQIKFTGRGGTDMHDVFEFYKNPDNTPLVLIMFSDMECAPITEDPGFPVVWVKLGGYGFNPDFGTVIDFEV
jgi:predicted metal-dependent peptidase